MQEHLFTNITIFGLLLFLFLTPPCLAQFKLEKLDKKSIHVKYDGNIVQAVSWTDSTGVNTVILTETKKTQIGALNGYHYLVSGDSLKQTWGFYDYIKDCDVDRFVYFVDKTFALTDLDKDGKAEVWIMYKVSCQGDISPVPMKIIMYEDNKKFAVRGTTRVGVSEKESMGGKFVFDEAFKKAPSAFRQYAENLWKKHIQETWNQ